jgi:hypothetical protein
MPVNAPNAYWRNLLETASAACQSHQRVIVTEIPGAKPQTARWEPLGAPTPTERDQSSGPEGSSGSGLPITSIVTVWAIWAEERPTCT